MIGNRELSIGKISLFSLQEQDIGVICASGLSMGLLTNSGEQKWHPASDETKAFAHKAADYCRSHQVELAHLALFYSFKLDGPATHLVGMQKEALLKANLHTLFDGLNEKEQEVLEHIRKK